MVSCELCGKTRSMQEAFVPGALAAVYKCAGRQPWLEHDADSPCTENAVARMRTSAGVYMPVNISALNIPPWSTQVNKILFRHLDAMEGKSDEALQSYIERKSARIFRKSQTNRFWMLTACCAQNRTSRILRRSENYMRKNTAHFVKKRKMKMRISVPDEFLLRKSIICCWIVSRQLIA